VNTRPLVMIGGAVVVAEAALILTDTGPNVWLVAALVTLVGVAIWFVTAVDPFVARPERAPYPPGNAVSYPDLRTTNLRQALAVGTSDSRHAQRLREQLVALVDDELRTVHGIDRHTHPDAAREVLGDELDRFVSDARPDATLTARGIERIVTLIEQL
jgi:hypothetical protein